MIANKLDEHKNLIAKFINDYIGSISDSFSLYPLDKSLYDELTRMTVAGKMYRGSILLLLRSLFTSSDLDKDALQIAAALEIFQTGILIQDDIMDNGPTRRGLPSIHIKFSEKVANADRESRRKFGESVAICLGDISFFLAFDLINATSVSSLVKKNLISLFAKEMMQLGFAQVQDLRLTNTDTGISEKEIIEMYIGKTSRYSFILPLLTVATIVEKLYSSREALERIGSAAGVVYQLVDDRIGLFGEPEHTGKSDSSDITEGKKTIYWHWIMQNCSPSDKKLFTTIYGNPKATSEDIARIKNLIKSSGAYDYIESMINTYQKEVEKEIAHLPLPPAIKQSFAEIVRFIEMRTK